MRKEVEREEEMTRKQRDVRIFLNSCNCLNIAWDSCEVVREHYNTIRGLNYFMIKLEDFLTFYLASYDEVDDTLSFG